LQTREREREPGSTVETENVDYEALLQQCATVVDNAEQSVASLVAGMSADNVQQLADLLLDTQVRPQHTNASHSHNEKVLRGDANTARWL